MNWKIMTLFIILNGIHLSTQMPSKYAQIERIHRFLKNSDAAKDIFRMVERCLVQCVSESVLEREGTAYPYENFESCIRIQLTRGDEKKRSMHTEAKRKERLHVNSKQKTFGRELVEMVNPESSDAGEDKTPKRNPSNNAKDRLFGMPKAWGTGTASGGKRHTELSNNVRTGNTGGRSNERLKKSVGPPHGRFGK